MEVIKRYNNRKLYSTGLSKYIKLDYVIDLVKSNSKFKVIEASSKKDITTETIKKSLTTAQFNRESLEKFIRSL